MSEEFATVGDITLCYETFGPDDGEPLLLVMGLATQMIAWHEHFCGELAERGFRVIRFDNRDIGRSSRMRGRPPRIREMVLRKIERPAYTLADMAGDAAGLLTALDIESAHVVGASMGGMIAQTLAARHPERVRSLVSIMSNTGNRWTGQPALPLLPLLLGRPPQEGREAYVERTVEVFRKIGSPGFPDDEERIREIAARSYDRGVDAAGPGRQLGAIVASGDRTRELRRIQAPTLVIHGNRDRLVRPSGGQATARAIPGARLLLIDGMGHDLPRGAWPQVIGGITENAGLAAQAAPSLV
jgi:pimeloyl-ACP methyl ester carboxylesterase